MTDAHKDQLARAYLKILKKHAPGIDAIGLSERLIEAADLLHDINTEESGIADLPVDLQGLGGPRFSEPRDLPRSAPPRIAAPPPAQGAVISGYQQQQPRGPLLTPDDPEYGRILAGQNLGPNGKQVVSASEIRRPVRRASNVPDVEYWSPADLIQTIIDNTPAELTIETHDREGHPRVIAVSRNTHNNAGLGTVTLTYKHASVTETDGFLTARRSFSVNDKDVDIEAAMTDLRTQLGGMYQPKPVSMEPVAGPERSLSQAYHEASMTDTFSDRLEPGAAMVANPANVIKAGLRRQNDQLAPVGRRF